MPNSVLQFVKLSRLFDAIFPIVSVFLGAAVTGHADDPKVIILVMAVTLLNSAAMVWNDIEDKDIDAKNGRAELKMASKRRVRTLIVCTTVALLIGLTLSGIAGGIALLLTCIAVIAIWVYNSKPLQASRTPIASIVILSFTGACLPFLIGASLGGITVSILGAALFWWLGRISLSVLKDYKDAFGDATNNKKTFLLRYGARWVARTSVAALIIGYVGFIVVVTPHVNASWEIALFIVAMIYALYLRRVLFNPKATYRQYDATFRIVARYQLLLDVGLVLWVM